ncbi:chromogranin B [Phyllostomus discolor]|uniref:Secretogranin-1 n=1 Tax=Phyllostomus discolor TaxID=89673 RepID=A0A834DPQ1_9CHIR|nr:chromogranin B [Phyllostomus discolor]
MTTRHVDMVRTARKRGAQSGGTATELGVGNMVPILLQTKKRNDSWVKDATMFKKTRWTRHKGTCKASGKSRTETTSTMVRKMVRKEPTGHGSRFERKGNTDDSFLEGEEGNGLTLNEKNFFPEYNYDWWEKKPFEEDVNWGYEKRNLVPKLDLKRQYDRMAELDQLLHYRKKSAEFPDFYDSEEPLSPRRTSDNEKDGARPGVLTEEEEKELENLAAMDLELQKIAEKFSGNRRG